MCRQSPRDSPNAEAMTALAAANDSGLCRERFVTLASRENWLRRKSEPDTIGPAA